MARTSAAFPLRGAVLRLAGFALAAATVRAASVADVFAYGQETGWTFGGDGTPTTNAPPAPAVDAGGVARRPDPERSAFERADAGRGVDASPFLRWLEAERSVPGESAFAAGWDAGGVYVLSEHGSAVRCLKRYDVRTGAVEPLTPTNGARDLLGPIWLPAGGAAGGPVLAGVGWRTESGTSNAWFDARMAAAERRLRASLPGARPEWIAAAPDAPYRWLAVCRFADAPPAWTEVDADAGTVRVLSRFPGPVLPTVRRAVRFRASDGATLPCVLTIPAEGGPFPLAVFPHGGPGALSDETFDERAWALCRAGFAVLQPNYRGSVGLGNRFRLEGWGPEGIRRALDDIHESVQAALADPSLPLSDAPPVLFGGSWGGYCALELLAEHPGFYAGAVSLFGAFDLPALVRSESARLSADGGPEATRELRALLRQFGDPADPVAMARLAALSPVARADAIAAPVILFHNRADAVIPFAQSETMFAALTNRDARASAHFRAGEGGHGFSAEAEARLYEELGPLLRSWTEQP